jgi:hypothetical protein
MAHFAKLDSDNKVIHVSVVNNSDILDSDGKESEQVGIEYLTKVHGYSKWKQTSYNGNFRKHYAGLDYTYDEKLDAFVPPSPYPSWILNETSCSWEAPTPYPSDGKEYTWDEESKSWKEMLDYLIDEASK